MMQNMLTFMRRQCIMHFLDHWILKGRISSTTTSSHHQKCAMTGTCVPAVWATYLALLLMIPTWTYIKSDEGIYVNMYVGSTIEAGRWPGRMSKWFRRQIIHGTARLNELSIHCKVQNSLFMCVFPTGKPATFILRCLKSAH